MDELLEEALADFEDQAPSRPVAAAQHTAAEARQQAPGSAPQAAVQPAGPGPSSASTSQSDASAAASAPGPKGLGSGLGSTLPKRKPAGGKPAAAPPLPPNAQQLADDLASLVQEIGLGAARPGSHDPGQAQTAAALQALANRANQDAGSTSASSSSGPAAPTAAAGASLDEAGADALAALFARLMPAGAGSAPGGVPDMPGPGPGDMPDFASMLQEALKEALKDPSLMAADGAPAGLQAAAAAAAQAASAGAGGSAAAGPSGSGHEGDADDDAFSSSALRGLLAQTQRTVKQQKKQTRGHVEGPPPGAAGGGAAGGAAGGGMFGDLFGALGALGAGGAGGEAGGPGMEMMVEYIMQNLLSKDVLYGPLKEIRDKYPPWLEAKQGELSPEEYQRYVAQYESIQRLCRQYEEAPGDFAKLVELVQEMQACGDPPGDIVEEMTGGAGRDLGSIMSGPPQPGGGDDMDLPPALAELTKDLDEKCCIQ